MLRYIATAFLLFMMIFPVQAADLRITGAHPDGTFVFLTPVGYMGDLTDVTKDVVDVEQRNLEFNPRITVIKSGQSVKFPNFDRTAHHVYSFSQAKRFEVPLGQHMSETILFDREGVVAVGCNIHDWMLAYVLVNDAPYYASVDGNGLGTIDVPAGEYTVSYWYPDQTEFTALGDVVTIAHPDDVIDLHIQISKGYHEQHMHQSNPSQNRYNYYSDDY